MVEGNELLLQIIKTVLGTNKGEWVLNPDEGITFANITGKIKNEDMIKFEIHQGLMQIDDTFMLSEFEIVQVGDRKYKVKAKAQNAKGAELSVDTAI